MMTQRRDIQPTLDHLEAALEASCASLMALESTRLGTPDGSPAIHCQLGEAIASVRRAIAEMRALHDVETSVLAFGFVLGGEPVDRSGGLVDERQLRPRRTA
jgi:hypothetical protein